MKRKLLASLLLIGMTCASVFSQHILSDSLIVHYNIPQLDSIFAANGASALTPNYSLTCYKIIYSTLNAKQTDTTIASGLMIVPDAVTCPMAIAVYDHGTTLLRNGVPSRMSDEAIIGMVLGVDGFFTILPDYLGLGDGPGFHPYVHARSEAKATIDMIFAAKEYAAAHSLALSDQLFLTGYSQGGHACMATHREIQEHYAGQLTVTASAPGSGPYNLSGIQAAGLAQNNYYNNPSYIPFLVFAYQSVYGNLYDSVQQFLLPPWDSILPPLFTEANGTDVVDAVMPHHIDSIAVAAQLTRYNTDSINDPLRIDLRDNDVYAWVPQAPIRMTYCTADEQVIYQSTLFAYNYFLAHGDSAVEALNGGNYNHYNCVQPALINMKFFFDGLRVSENNLNLALTADSASSQGGSNASVKVSVSGGTGYTIHWSNNSTDSVLTGLHDGIYSVTVTAAGGCTKVRSISTGGTLTGITPVTAVVVNQLTVYPIPSSEMLFYNFQCAQQGPYTVELLDMSGRIVYNKDIDVWGTGTNGSVYTKELANGVYSLKISSANFTLVKKVVVKN